MEGGQDAEPCWEMLDGGKGAVGGDEGGAGAGGGGGEVLESGRDSATVLLKIITPYQVSIFGFSTLSPESHLCASDGKLPIHNLFLIVHSPLIKEIMNTLSDVTEAVIILPDYTKSDLIVSSEHDVRQSRV